MAKELTKKRKGFVKDYIETGVGVEAVKRNFNVSNDRSASVIASQLLNDEKVQQALEDALPDELLAEKHLALLNKMNGDEIDVNAVKSGLEMAYKIKGKYAPEKHINYNANVSIEHKERANSALGHLRG